jgi:hypothetical protein
MVNMGDGSLTFAIPVRDPRGVDDWGAVKRLMAVTLRSLYAQRGPRPTVVIGASPGTDLPELPPGTQVVPVDLPYHPLPPEQGPERWDAILVDKGLRLAHALAAARPQGHVMVVDYDDLVSSRLTEVVAASPDAPGWVVDAGYLWDGGPMASLLSTGFNDLCGTSLLVRSDLLRIPADPADPAELEWIKTTLGSHKRWHGLFELENVGFPAAVYRVGSGANVSGAIGQGRRVLRAARRKPQELVQHLRVLRPWAAVRTGFGL